MNIVRKIKSYNCPDKTYFWQKVCLSVYIVYVCFIDVRLGFKVDQIGPKQSGTFFYQISVHFGLPSQNVLKSDLKKSQICPIWGQSDVLYAQIFSHWFRPHTFSVVFYELVSPQYFPIYAEPKYFEL